jgi:hypothetical protein
MAHHAFHPVRRGISLIETAVSIAAVSVLIVSLGSVVVLSSKAIPDKATVTPVSLSAAATLDQITEELRYAIAASELSPSAITFTVPCRDGCGSPDTIRYALSGTDLTRTVNGKTASILSGVKALGLNYTKRKVTQTSNTQSTVSSGELLFSKFTGPGSILSSINTMQVTGTTWMAVGFTIDEVAVPATVTSVKITRVTVRAQSGGIVGPVVATVCRPQTAGSAIPGAAVGSPGTLPVTGMTASAGWVEIPFTDAVFNGPVSDLVIVFKGSGTGGGKLQYINDTLALLDSRSLRWTGNSGSTWQPGASLLGAYDLFYNVYGSYETTTNGSTSVDTYYLTNVDLDMQVGSATRVQSGTHVLNEPGVAGP